MEVTDYIIAALWEHKETQPELTAPASLLRYVIV